jgi:hypothetical protein
MDTAQPQRHGPYHKLAYVHRGHPVCRFVRPDCLAELRRRLAAYKRFRQLIDRWIELSIQRAQVEFFARPTHTQDSHKPRRPSPPAQRKSRRV